jgi:hypothetical protein
MEWIQVLVVLLLVVLLIVGLADVVGALNGFDSSPYEVTSRSSAEIEEVASEGDQAMDDLSEQYLNKVYDQITNPTRW